MKTQPGSLSRASIVCHVPRGRHQHHSGPCTLALGAGVEGIGLWGLNQGSPSPGLSFSSEP